MCGISGYFNPRLNEQEYKTLSLNLQKRGPDYFGFKRLSLNNLPLFFAHNRLKILDLSSTANQPITLGKYTMIFNGEIYNHLILRKKLNLQLESSSDTLTLIHAFNAWGLEKTLQNLDGMFAIALFDSHAQKLFLMRDRLGVKPLFYSHQNGAFAFSSTLKAMPKEFLRQKSMDSIARFMSLTYIPAPFSLYENVYKLKAGHYLEFDGKNLQEKQFFSLSKGQKALEDLPKNYSAKEANKTFKSLFDSAVSKRLLSDVELGVFLSGGIDSSLVTSVATKFVPKIKTFTIGFNEKSYNEAGYAKQIAKILKTEHYEFNFSAKNALDLISTYKDAFDEPFGDASALALLYLSQKTSPFIKVALCGDGGDEFFLGYSRYYFAQKYSKIFSLVPSFLRPLLSNFAKIAPSDKLKKLVYPLANPSIENLYSVINTSLKPWEFGRIFNTPFAFKTYTEILNTNLPIRTSSLLQDLALIDQHFYLSDDILVKSDRATMHYSIEARSPFLDYKLGLFANSLPVNLRQQKQLPKNYLSEFLPQDLINRPKKGFSVPLKLWFRGELKEPLLETINKLEEPFNKKELRKMAEEHFKQRANHEYIFWNLLALNI